MFNFSVIFCTRYNSGYYHLLEGAGGNDPPFRPEYLCTLERLRYSLINRRSIIKTADFY